jgi:hypothetical protein
VNQYVFQLGEKCNWENVGEWESRTEERTAQDTDDGKSNAGKR